MRTLAGRKEYAVHGSLIPGSNPAPGIAENPLNQNSDIPQKPIDPENYAARRTYPPNARTYPLPSTNHPDRSRLGRTRRSERRDPNTSRHQPSRSSDSGHTTTPTSPKSMSYSFTPIAQFASLETHRARWPTAPQRRRSAPDQITETPRYQHMVGQFGALTAEVMCGCLVHVGVEDLEQAGQVINHLSLWLPCAQACTHQYTQPEFAVRLLLTTDEVPQHDRRRTPDSIR